MLLFLLMWIFWLFYYLSLLFLSKREVPNSHTFVCNEQVIGAAQFYCTVWCCAVFIRAANEGNKIDCTSESRDHHLYWRDISLFKLLEVSVTVNRKWLQPSKRGKSISLELNTLLKLFSHRDCFFLKLQQDSYLEMKMRMIWEGPCFSSTSSNRSSFIKLPLSVLFLDCQLCITAKARPGRSSMSSDVITSYQLLQNH